MGKIHKKGIRLPRELWKNVILNHLSIATSLFFRKGKGVPWLTMNNGFILIIPSGGNHGWTPANYPLQRRRGIFTDVRPSSAFSETRRVCCSTISHIRIKPSQLEWRLDAKKDHLQPTINAKLYLCKVISLHDNLTTCCEKQTFIVCIESLPISSILSRLGELSYLPVDATRTYGHTLLQLRKSPKILRPADFAE